MGGVGLRLRVYDRVICFANCHFAAHLKSVNCRNADFDHIYRTMMFSRSNLLNNVAVMVQYLILSCSLAFSTYIFWLLYSSGLRWVLSLAAGITSAALMLRGSNAATLNPEEGKPDLSEADIVIFCGDFNYRLSGISYDEARDFVSQRSFDWLQEKDQLRAEMKAGKVFQGMREALIRFPPTYKFERGKAGLGGYDSGEKKRIPAWCDRILYRDNRSAPTIQCSLRCPVVASILQYDACMDVVESDHKPVRCKFNVEIARVDRSVRRQEFGKIYHSNDLIRSLCVELCYVPETLVSTNSVVLQNQDTSVLRIINRSGKDKAIFQITCEGQSTRGSFGFPRWLEVTPAAGIIKPDEAAEISVHHADFHTPEEGLDGIPQSWWSDDNADKEVILLVNISGSCSTGARTHRVCVRHCFSGKAVVTGSESLKLCKG